MGFNSGFKGLILVQAMKVQNVSYRSTFSLTSAVDGSV